MKIDFLPLFFLALGITVLTFPDIFAYLIGLGMIAWGIKGILTAKRVYRERRESR